MRSPVIAFGIFAAAAVSPTLVGAAPASPNLPAGVVPGAPGHTVPPTPAGHLPGMVRRELESNDKHHRKHHRRVEDYRTAGGNAYSGSAGTVSGGDVINDAESNDDAITNTGASE